MEAYNRLPDDRKPRVIFIIAGLPVLIISVLSMYLYCPLKHENVEYARISNQGILLFALVIFHYIGGFLSLRWNIDYSKYKPLAACICWNMWVLICLILQTNSIILQYNEGWSIKILSAQLATMFTALMGWQISVHWNLYRNGQQRRD